MPASNCGRAKRSKQALLSRIASFGATRVARALFGRFGVTGVVNVDLTPEFAAKLSTALGATMPKGSYIAINRNMHRSWRMYQTRPHQRNCQHGYQCLDLDTVPTPVVRHYVRSHSEISAGIHVRLSPFDQRVVDIRIIDKNGMNQSKSAGQAVSAPFLARISGAPFSMKSASFNMLTTQLRLSRKFSRHH